MQPAEQQIDSSSNNNPVVQPAEVVEEPKKQQLDIVIQPKETLEFADSNKTDAENML